MHADKINLLYGTGLFKIVIMTIYTALKQKNKHIF